MASKNVSERKCFTFHWKCENLNCFSDKSFFSPSFVVDEVKKTTFKMLVRRQSRFSGYTYRMCLFREPDREGIEVEVEFELLLVALDGTVPQKSKKIRMSFPNRYLLDNEWNDELFLKIQSPFHSEDNFTVQCKVWKINGGISKDVQCFARTRLEVEKRSFLWKIENFSTLPLHEKRTYPITSMETGNRLMSLYLFLSSGLNADKVFFCSIRTDEEIRYSTFKFSVVDCFGNPVESLEEEFSLPRSDPFHSAGIFHRKEFSSFFTNGKVMLNKDECLPNDVLSIKCECTFFRGKVTGAIEEVSHGSFSLEKIERSNQRSAKKNTLSVPKTILVDNVKSMLNNNCLSDVQVRTGGKTYPAHKFILSARSPVFNAMFSNDMKENLNHCVDIEDFSSETVASLLQYVYSGEVGELQLGSATELYEAADKYQILCLRDVCSSYLKNNLHLRNASEALLLADLHQDEALKRSVQSFIMRRRIAVSKSAEWKQLMEINPTLASETMRDKLF